MLLILFVGTYNTSVCARTKIAYKIHLFFHHIFCLFILELLFFFFFSSETTVKKTRKKKFNSSRYTLLYTQTTNYIRREILCSVFIHYTQIFLSLHTTRRFIIIPVVNNVLYNKNAAGFIQLFFSVFLVSLVVLV